MRLTPGQDWTWGFTKKSGKDYLTLNLVSDDGQHFSFESQYEINDLRIIPKVGQSFCIEDGILLTAFQEGLYEIGIEQDEICIVLGLNALVCSKFAKLTMPMGRYFYARDALPNAKLGQVVSLYSKDGAIGDFVVLDQDQSLDVVRVMLANPEFEFSGHYIKLGQMIRVSRNCLNPYRYQIQKHKKVG